MATNRVSFDRDWSGATARSVPASGVLPAHAPVQRQPAHVQLIEQSHQRCAALGLTRIERLDYEPLMRSDLTVARERNQRLYQHAAPVMEMLFEQIVNTESMIVLTDAHGTILHSVGDDEFLERAGKVALTPGVNWAEHSKGTNAIGTALFEERATLVHADEHFMHANQFLTCSAVPIFDPRGSMLGVLDVTGDHRSYHQHTMGLVRMSARMIENHWLSDDYINRLRLHFHSRVEFIGTLMEGILAVGPDGKIAGANRGALEQLALSGAALRMHTLGTLFGISVSALVDHFRSPLATPLALQGNGGRQFHVQARFNWPVWQRSAVALNAGAAATDAAGAQTVGAAVDDARVEESAAHSYAHAQALANSGLAQLATGDPQMAVLTAKIRRVLDREIPILILGETGTGKDLLARAIHHDSERARQPFVAVNCASIPDTLIEAELFGYKDGAFAGARKKGAVGKIVQANGGTLYLDEIGDMPLPLQAHLLRVLQDRQVLPLGSDKPVSVDVAIVCATRHNLREMIANNLFREDLYYRLNGLAVRLPPLRERSDLLALAERIVLRENAGRPMRLAPDVLRLLQHCHWPGNVRQLFNVLRTAIVMAAGEMVITREHLSDDFIEDAELALRAASLANAAATPVVATPSPPTAGPSPLPAAPPLAEANAAPAVTRPLQEMEIAAIRAAVDAAGGNISEASKRLGISRNTIYRKLRWNAPA